MCLIICFLILPIWIFVFAVLMCLICFSFFQSFLFAACISYAFNSFKRPHLWNVSDMILKISCELLILFVIQEALNFFLTCTEYVLFAFLGGYVLGTSKVFATISSTYKKFGCFDSSSWSQFCTEKAWGYETRSTCWNFYYLRQFSFVLGFFVRGFFSFYLIAG